MYIRILDYLIDKLEKMREKARTPSNKGISAKEWAKTQKNYRQKSYK
jgi:hypothetical protein